MIIIYIKIGKKNLFICISLLIVLVYSNFISLAKILYPLPYQAPVCLVIAVIFLLYVSFQTKKSITIISKRNIFIILVILLLNRNMDFKMYEFLSFFKYIILILICLLLSNLKGWEKIFIKITLIFSLIQSLATIVLWIYPNLAINYVVPLFDSTIKDELLRQINNGYATGLTTHYSVNGIYLAIGTGFATINFCNKKNFSNLGILLIISSSLLLTAKRGPLLFCILSLLICYIIYNKFNIKTIIKFSLLLWGLFFITYIIVKYIPLFSNIVERFTNVGKDITGGRQPLYMLAYDMFRNNKLIGNGWGSYKYFANASIIGSIYGRDSFMYAHNVYLQVLAETGVLGLCLYIIFCGYNLFNNIKLINTSKGNVKYFLMYSLFTQIFFLLYSFSGNALYDFPILIPYFISISLCLSTLISKKQRR